MIFIKLNTYTNMFEFLPCKVSWIENDERNEEFTDNPSLFEQNIKSYSSSIHDFKIENYEPTEEQLIRLEEINNIKEEYYKDGFIQQINNFIETGYIDHNYPDFMVNVLLEKYKQNSKKILLEKYAKELASIRYDKEVSGVEFMGKKVKTDRESQSTITSTVVLFNTGSMDKIDFKCDNGEWLHELDKDSFLLLAKTVSGHVNACFKAESMTNEVLLSYELEQLMEKSSSEFGETLATDNHEYENIDTKVIDEMDNLILFTNDLNNKGFSTVNVIETTDFNFPVTIEINNENKTYVVLDIDLKSNSEDNTSVSSLNLVELYNNSYSKIIEHIKSSINSNADEKTLESDETDNVDRT